MARILCQRCERPEAVCICSGLEAHKSPIQVVILQTPREQKHALNSGRIVRLGISGCRIFVGEDFSGHKELQTLLTRWHGKTWLLYPGDNALQPEQMARNSGDYGAGLLVVLDATWRKARRMLYINPFLSELPRVALPESLLSRYRIRKVPGQGYLSTVEAVVACLQRAGHPKAGCEQMLVAFEQMIDQQIQSMGETVFRENYRP